MIALVEVDKSLTIDKANVKVRAVLSFDASMNIKVLYCKTVPIPHKANKLFINRASLNRIL